MKKAILITVFTAMAAIFTISCGGKEESKVPKSMDELWGTTWECIDSIPDGYPIYRVSFASIDSIVWAAYLLPNGLPQKGGMVITASTYTKPDLFCTEASSYFDGFDIAPDIVKYEPPLKFCTFTEEGYLLTDIMDKTNYRYAKVK